MAWRWLHRLDACMPYLQLDEIQGQRENWGELFGGTRGAGLRAEDATAQQRAAHGGGKNLQRIAHAHGHSSGVQEAKVPTSTAQPTQKVRKQASVRRSPHRAAAQTTRDATSLGEYRPQVATAAVATNSASERRVLRRV